MTNTKYLESAYRSVLQAFLPSNPEHEDKIIEELLHPNRCYDSVEAFLVELVDDGYMSDPITIKKDAERALRALRQLAK